jgi:hypothetical protein
MDAVIASLKIRRNFYDNHEVYASRLGGPGGSCHTAVVTKRGTPMLGNISARLLQKQILSHFREPHV